MDNNSFDLFEKIFVNEDNRIGLQQIKTHKWLL